MKRSAPFLFDEGAIDYAYDHFHSHVSYVVQSKFEVMDNNQTKLLKSGNRICIEPLKKYTWAAS